MSWLSQFNWSQFINTVLFIFGTFVAVYKAIHKANVNKQELPENKVPLLESLASIAVRAVEQVYTHNPGKRDIAIGMVIDSFVALRIKPPSKEEIGKTIESLVLLLPKETKE